MNNKKKKISFIIFSCLAGMMLTLFSMASIDFPKTPAGTRAEEIVKLINSGDAQAVEEYIRNHYSQSFKDAFPLAAHKAIFKTTKSMFGQMKVVEISKSEPTEIKLTVQSDSREAWLNLNVVVEPDEPHQITSLGIAPGTRPMHLKPEKKEEFEPAEQQSQEESQPKVISPEEWENFHQGITKKAENNEFSGVILVAKDGKPIFHEAYGLASKRFNFSNRLDTKFNLGSCNKMLTSIGILQLMEKGKLSLNDPIGKYLDMFPEDIAQKVKIKHLLNMRSGWGDYWGNETYLAKRNQLRKVSDYMEFIKDMPLDFEPGTNLQHSNTGFEVAGAIIETLTGMDYFEYIKENIYEPAGMTNSDSYHRDGPVKNLAVGYTNMNPNDTVGEKYDWENTFLISPRGTPTGGGYSTTEDLLKLDRALKDHRLLTSEYTNFFLNRLEGKLGDPLNTSRMYRIIGGAPGMGAHIGIDVRSGYSLHILINYDFPVVMDVSKEILKMIGLI